MVRKVGRLYEIVRHEGVVSAAKAVASVLTRNVYVDETHVWYEFDVSTPAQPPELEDGLRLRRADGDGVARYQELDQLPTATAREWLDRGAGLWLVCEGDRPAFGCWIFRDATPVLAARGGWLPLPPEVVCLENSVTSPAFRGRGIAPVAWARIMKALHDEGLRSMVTKVDETNTASRRAVTKAGGCEIAMMHHRRRGPSVTTTVRVLRETPASAWLASHL